MNGVKIIKSTQEQASAACIVKAGYEPGKCFDRNEQVEKKYCF